MKKYIIKYIKNGMLKKIIIAIAISIEATAGVYAQTPMNKEQMSKMNNDSIPDKKQSAMNMVNGMAVMVAPFITHMGMPHQPGAYNLRFAVLSTRVDKKSETDFALQFTTGLTKFVGLHLVLQSDKTEIMFQFAALKSKNGMNAFSPLIEFEIPTHEGINTQVGFASTLSNSHIAFHQVLHYGVKEKNFEGGAALVYKFSNSIFLVTELVGEKKLSEQASLNLLGGIKIRITNFLLLGFGVQFPVTTNRDFSSQFIFQPDLQLRN